MADKKISELTEKTTPVGTDLVEIVDDPAGTPISKRSTLANLISKVWNALSGHFNDLTEETSPGDDDLFVMERASDGIKRKVKKENLADWETIAKIKLTTANKTLFDVDSISTDFDCFRITYYVRAVGGGADMRGYLRFNNDTGNNYVYQLFYGDNSSASATRSTGNHIRLWNNLAMGDDVANDHVTGQIIISKPRSDVEATVTMHEAGSMEGNLRTGAGGGRWNNTTSKITRIAIVTIAGDTQKCGAGSFALIEGIKF